MGRVGNLSHGVSTKATGSGIRPARISKEVSKNKSKRSVAGASAVRKPLVLSGTDGLAPYEEFANIWGALGCSPEEAANLETRSDLMIQLRELIRAKKWTQAQAAKQCRVSQPRISDLLRGSIDKFSLDALVNMAAALGQRVSLKLEAA